MELGDLFIEPEREITIARGVYQPASWLRRSFSVDRPIRTAELAITACGLYHASLNGKPVTSRVFTPGWTHYQKRVRYQCYDVTPLMAEGPNAIGVVLGDGWYRGSIGARSRRYVFGDKTKLAAILTIVYADGTTERLVTDERWRATQDDPLRKSDWMEGEVYDARRAFADWSRPDFDDGAWHGVYRSAYEGNVVADDGVPIEEHERFSPEVVRTPDGATVLDFGQNMFGYVEFRVSGSAGTTVTLHHGETLDEGGNFTVKNIQMVLPGTPKLLQRIDYTLMMGHQTYKPIFSGYGFRYVKLENWPEPVVAANFTAIAVYASMDESGTFSCSDAAINRLVENAKWSQKSNFVAVPTDCPTRERAGWTGDIAVFCETGSYLMRTDRFLSDWMKDVALQQRDDGRVASITPPAGMPSRIDGSAGWADAAIIVPHTLYRMYGDRSILVEQYATMQRLVAFMEGRAHRSRRLKKLGRGTDRRFVIDTGFRFGEWLEPDTSLPMSMLRALFAPDAEAATAYFAHSTRLLSEIAEVLDRRDDARRYAALAENVRAAYRRTFTTDGLVRSRRQARLVRPLAFELLDTRDASRNAAILNRLVIANDYKIGTGFLSTPFILNVLTDHEYVDTAYRAAENRRRPGWLYAVDKGATTIWESWNGIDERGVPHMSHNHYALGSVVGWYFSRVAGITSLDPGFKRVRIKPIPGGSLTHAACTYRSAAGTIRSAWRVSGRTITFDIEVPTSAEIDLPDGSRHDVEAGRYRFRRERPFRTLPAGG